MKHNQLSRGIFASIGMLVLILDGKTALEGARMGIELCLRTVIPSLFPFFVLSIFVTSAFSGSSFIFLRPIGQMTGIPAGAETILISGFLGGYPVGAQCVSQAYQSGQISKQDAEAMLAFCSNAGPAFIFGMLGTIFPQRWQPWALWGIHIVSSIIAGSILAKKHASTAVSSTNYRSAAETLNTAVRAITSVCGWVILFRVLLTFLQRWGLWILPIEVQVAFTGLLELSNGCCELAKISDLALRFMICSGILAFGGLCVVMQTASVTSGLSLRYYFSGKLLQMLFSLLLSALIVYRKWRLLSLLATFFLLIPLIKQKKSSIRPAVGV